VTEEVRFDLEYAVTMLMTNDFDNVTKIHGLLPTEHIDSDRCVVEAQKGCLKVNGNPVELSAIHT
jgi:hypothetical protein